MAPALRFLLLVLLFTLPYASVLAQEEEDELCMDCHSDNELTKERNGRTVKLFVNYAAFAQSTHGAEGCVSCHGDIDVDDLPHEDELEKVDCSMCHDREVESFEKSLHGEAVSEGRSLAPTCIRCHGKHYILPSTNERAPTYVMNVPSLCGSCHKDGTTVSELRTMSQRHILADYSQSIHGDGLFRRGLTVTAVCTSCHLAHNILHHEDRSSSINHYNIAGTCMKCHAQIEDVHVQVVEKQLWQRRPNEIPICVDCHKPHTVQQVQYEESFPDDLCLSCHGDETLHREEAGETLSLFTDTSVLAQSVHTDIACVKCHANVTPQSDPSCIDSGPVDCSMCHAAEVEEYQGSYHGTQRNAGNEIAPYCTDCHGDHGTLAFTDPESPTYPKNVPDLCGRCHREGNDAAVAYTGEVHEIVENYTMSIHGKGLLESGLLVTATCADCHTAHGELPISDSLSTVAPGNIAATCAQCHQGILEIFQNSVHSPTVTQTDKKLPVCNDCHFSHTISRVDEGSFRQNILNQCGTCHEEVTETYFDTFHGKVSKLGSVNTARCSDCHGSHNILPHTNPASTLSKENAVSTCQSCHPGANEKFVGYLTHATHDDPEKHPSLFYTFWFMTILLGGTFAFFGVHTLMWLTRSVVDKRKHRKQDSNGELDA